MANKIKNGFRVLVINPGSTSTKISVFHGEEELFTKNVEHDWKTLQDYALFDQTPLREEAIRAFLESHDCRLEKIDAIVSRGCPLVKPVVCGIYEVNDAVIEDAVKACRNHPCSLGPSIADKLATSIGKKAYTIHPANIDEMMPLAKISGLKGFERDHMFHVESHKAVGRQAAKDLGKTYEDVNLIVAHLGGGVSICAHQHGKCVDTAAANKSTGPFTGRRANGISPWNMLDLCFSEGATRKSVEDILLKKGGLVSYLGTDDCIEIEKRIEQGDREAALVYEAMAYRISKEICGLAAAFCGKTDAICLTGGMAYSSMLCRWIEERTAFIAPLLRYPGSLEQTSMNEYMQEVLNGTVQPHIYGL